MPAETHSQQLVVFTLGADQYALGIEQVQEIIRYEEPRVVASPIAAVRGVISLRGRIVPIYDISEQLGTDSAPADHAKIVIVESVDGTAGICVDEVDEVLSVDSDQFEELPDTGNDMIDRIVKLGDRLIVLVNLDGLFSENAGTSSTLAPAL